MPDRNRPVIAVFNSSLETLEIFRELLDQEGFFPVINHVDDVRLGKIDLIDFLRVHDPAVIVWDVAPPYTENWHFLHMMRELPGARRPWVVTTTNARALQDMTGEEALEIVGKPYDLRQIVEAVRSRLPS